jgi:hypothetical protein
MRKREVTLENWAVVRSAHSPSFEELRPGAHLMGVAMGHPTRPGLDFIYTSRIVNVDNANRLVETSNTLYRLGEPHETYNAWQRAAPDSTSEVQKLQGTAA